MRLFNRADGVDGHYCVGRISSRFCAPTVEFWNEDAKTGPQWTAFGTLYASKEAAADVLYRLCQVPARPRQARPLARASR